MQPAQAAGVDDEVVAGVAPDAEGQAADGLRDVRAVGSDALQIPGVGQTHLSPLALRSGGERHATPAHRHESQCKPKSRAPGDTIRGVNPLIHHRPEAQRFDTVVDGHLALCDYRRSDDNVDLHHTEVPPPLEGRGLAAALVAATLAWARHEGLRVLPSCSYVAAYMRRHPETLDLLHDRAAPVLAFWFGEPAATTPRAEWFRKDPAFDTEIRARFGALIEVALGGGLQAWDATSAGALARIVVLDQFTRNAFRDSARAFAGDTLALAAAQALVARGDDRRLPPLQRWFAYLPFEHAEDRAVQRQSMALFDALAAEHPGLADTRHWALKHFEIVERFGRYPHRNALLGRESTPEETAFLQQPGSSF
ncbi:MAG: hypothetical protein C0505_00280 [Leptothrix sp. (in: Bacteria)]|nr:hypothetical protein [Leptothrix sp. (in: b-proteobacteria)]